MKKYVFCLIALFQVLSAFGQDSNTINNLKTFAKACGYVKYFHPSDEASQIEWDKFTVYGVSEILKCKTKEDVIGTLDYLFQPIAPTAKFTANEPSAIQVKDFTPDHPEAFRLTYWQHRGVGKDMNQRFETYKSVRVNRSSEEEQLFDYQPEFGEIISKEIGQGVYCQIPLVLYFDDQGTYPQADTEHLQQLQENYEEDPEMLWLRLGDVIITYNIFQHFYPYFDVVEVNWEQELENALERSFTNETDYDHLITLQRFTATLHDGHIGVYDNSMSHFIPPISWEWIEGQLVVTEVEDSTLSLKVGDVVTQIEGQSTEGYFEEVYPRISAGTEGWLHHQASRMSMSGKEGTPLVITVNNEPITLIRNKNPYSNASASKTQQKSYRLLEDDIFYLNLDVIEMDTINKLLPQLEKSKAIICDLRGYPNGNHELIAHLLSTNDTTKAWMQIPQIVYPDHEKITGYDNRNWLEMMHTRQPYLGDKKIVFITDGSAISYAESYMGYIEGYDLATIVGQPTAGTNGNVNGFTLPGGYYITWTGMKVLKHNGSQHHGIGVLPDVYVSRTLQGIREGRDEFLEKAIEIAKQ